VKLCFVVGHEDTPEAYWRVLLPARHFRAPALVVDVPETRTLALSAEVLWLYQPTGFAAAELAEKAAARGRHVIVDMAENPWLRGECRTLPYRQARLDALERALAVADTVVVSVPGLLPAFAGTARTVALPAVLPLSAQWMPAEPDVPPIISWWSDGRQRAGFEEVAPAVVAVLEHTGCRHHHLQFAHLRPLFAHITDDETHQGWARRFHVYLEGELPPEGNLAMLRDAMRPSAVAIECYPEGEYRETVSDVPLLRAAALGIPTLTTREHAPPGCLSAPPDAWEDALFEILREPGPRRALSVEALRFAKSRASFAPYDKLIEEVLP
jgi:hypothetical protein